jgi:imidazolonepropionase
MARHGTTTVEAKSGYGLDEVAECKMLRVMARLGVVPTYLGAHVPPPGVPSGEYVGWMCRRMLPLVARRGLARFADVYCDVGAFALDEARFYLECAANSGLGLKVHADQFRRTGAAILAVETGAASADHLEAAGDAEIAALAGSETVATLLPGSVFHLALRSYAPARALIEAGAAVALATDFNPGTSPTYNMQMVLSLACTEMRMTPAEAISAATVNGAHALRLGARVGSLEAGKDADLIVLALSDYREIPYYFGTNNVRATMIRGEVLT